MLSLSVLLTSQSCDSDILNLLTPAKTQNISINPTTFLITTLNLHDNQIQVAKSLFYHPFKVSPQPRGNRAIINFSSTRSLSLFCFTQIRLKDSLVIHISPFMYLFTTTSSVEALAAFPSITFARKNTLRRMMNRIASVEEGREIARWKVLNQTRLFEVLRSIFSLSSASCIHEVV
jgi:hypothetical protein